MKSRFDEMVDEILNQQMINEKWKLGTTLAAGGALLGFGAGQMKDSPNITTKAQPRQEQLASKSGYAKKVDKFMPEEERLRRIKAANAISKNEEPERNINGHKYTTYKKIPEDIVNKRIKAAKAQN